MDDLPREFHEAVNKVNEAIHNLLQSKFDETESYAVEVGLATAYLEFTAANLVTNIPKQSRSHILQEKVQLFEQRLSQLVLEMENVDERIKLQQITGIKEDKE